MASQTKSRNRTHRLKREDLVMEVFSIIAEEFERRDEETIWDVLVPTGVIRESLGKRQDTRYSSDQWLHTQLKRYEQDLGVTLFRREKASPARRDGEWALALYPEMVDFYQKQHLYVTEKIKVANGTYDFISSKHDTLGHDAECCSILLGAGSTVYHLATIFAEESYRTELSYCLYTHNAGFMQKLLNSSVNYGRISLKTVEGTLEPVTRTLLTDSLGDIRNAPLDFVVQGTSCVCDGRLYIESKQEAHMKASILRDCSGTKILVCTKHEFSDHPLPNTEPYGSLTDYDYLIVPHSPERRSRKLYEKVFEAHRQYLEPEIFNWSYAIYRVAPSRT